MQSHLLSLVSSARRHLLEDAQSEKVKFVRSAYYNGSSAGAQRHWNNATSLQHLADSLNYSFGTGPFGGKPSDRPTFKK